MASVKTSSCCLRTYSMMRHVHRISKLQDMYTPVRCVKSASQQPFHDVDSFHAPVYAEKNLLMDVIQKNVVYDDENLLALNKPAGVPLKVLHGEEVPSIFDILEDLRQCYDAPELDVILGLSRKQSGIILLSKHALAKEKLKKALKGTRTHQDLNYEFVCVCLGEPKFKTEVEKVRYQRKDINDRQQTVLIPHFSQYIKRSILSSFNVIAEVLATSPLEMTPKVSLVGITCDSAKKECLEMYMAEHLSPILGDHVYSHRVVTVAGVSIKNDVNTAVQGPQVIPTEVKHKLNIRAHDHLVPLHLHRSGMVLKRFPHKKSEPFLIEAPLPEFFVETMDRLELQPYDEDADEFNQEQHSQ